MTPEVWQYFQAKYQDCRWRVVPGHWPDFKTTAEVDRWFEMRERLMKSMLEETEKELIQGTSDIKPRGVLQGK